LIRPATRNVASLTTNFSSDVAGMLAGLGVRHAFGVSGGGIGAVWRALIHAPTITTMHFRNEAGATFAAIEASVELRGPVAVFCTTGPGITNTLTGVAAARAEGAKIVIVSGRTSSEQRGLGAVQETPMPSADFFTPGWLFDEVFMLESSGELPQIARRLQHGFDCPGAYVAHLSIPVGLQNAPSGQGPRLSEEYRLSGLFPAHAAVEEVIQLMTTKRFAVWVGHGARFAARQVRALVDLAGVPVLATPRGKGIVPEFDPRYVMVTGLGGHEANLHHLERYAPEFVLVLGTRLGEPSSGWNRRLVPPGGLVHVDIDATVPGTVFEGPVLAIQADIEAFLDQVLLRADQIPHHGFVCPSPFPPRAAYRTEVGPIRPQAVLSAIQASVLDEGFPVLTEPGGSMAWASHLLKMANPGQLRIVGSFGSMGQMVCGVIGAAVARQGPAVCLTGDGSMLMNNEINTAVEYNIPAVWVILNNGRYQMCETGMGFRPEERHARFRECDFAGIARAMGAAGESIRTEHDLEPALRRALQRGSPGLLDVNLDTNALPPFESRFKTLK